MNTSLSEDQDDDMEKQVHTTDDEDLVNVDGTKVKLSKRLLSVRVISLTTF